MLEQRFSSGALIVNPYRKVGIDAITRHAGKISGSEARLAISSMVTRNAAFVFGERLARYAADHIVMDRRYNSLFDESGELVVRRRYASTIGAIAIGHGWEEGTPQFQLLCGYLYAQAIVNRKNDLVRSGGDNNLVVKLDSIQTNLERAIAAFIIETRIPESEQQHILLLRKLLTGQLIPSQQRVCAQFLSERKLSLLYSYLSRRNSNISN